MFDTFDAALLARIQFAFTVSFHIIFPAFSIGLASYLAVLEGLWLTRREQVYLDLFNYWKSIFAVVFGMGVVSGIVMSYEFGTNWSVFSDKAGPVIGPLMGYEVLSAFFLEAGFLGVMLFGMKRVGEGLHFFATAMVAAGTFISAFWILAVNSWMQTPAGFGINEAGQFVATDWWAVIFNPSFTYRLVHMVLAAYLTTALAVGAVGAWHLNRSGVKPAARTMFSMAMWMAAIVAPIQIFAGDMHGLNTLEHQPAKIAAMEANWETRTHVPLVLFAWPDETTRENLYEITIPSGASVILGHSPSAEVPGLDRFEDNHPPVAPVFFAFRIMVGVGVLMLLVSWSAAYFLYRRHTLPRPLAMLMVPMALSGWIAVLAGWYTTEIGRQPWLVQGVLTTEQALGPVPGSHVAFTLSAYLALYAILLVVYLGVLVTLALKAAKEGDEAPLPAVLGRALSQPVAGE